VDTVRACEGGAVPPGPPLPQQRSGQPGGPGNGFVLVAALLLVVVLALLFFLLVARQPRPSAPARVNHPFAITLDHLSL
jgi:hypothetical protein